jgi:hypothetical protein
MIVFIHYQFNGWCSASPWQGERTEVRGLSFTTARIEQLTLPLSLGKGEATLATRAKPPTENSLTLPLP